MKKVLAIGIAIFLACLVLIPSVSATWCDNDYGKKAPILINNTGGSEQTYYQVELNYTYDSDMNANFSDIRVYNESDCSLIPLWNESAVASSWNKIWFNATNIPTSSWTNDTYYLYYDYASASSASNGTNTFEFFDDFETLSEIGEWTPYANNPVLSPEGDEDYTTWSSVWKDGTTHHMFYSYRDVSDKLQIGHATSSDGKNWTKDSVNNPLLTNGTSGDWDDDYIWCPMVWKEDSTWYMVYSGRKASTLAVAIGLATASNPEGPWTKEGTNPVLEGTASEWDDGEAENWGLMKIGSTYYLWYNSFGVRETGLATSTNLTSWTKDSNNPIFTGGRFCVFPFKYGSYYYLIVPHYTSGTDYSEFELYRDTNPTFYSANRELVKVIKTCPASGWDSHDEDTPCVLTTDINRDNFSSNEIWTYYGGESGGVWKTGLLEETDIGAALAMPSGETWQTTGSPTIDNSILTVDAGAKQTSTSANVPKDRAVRTKTRFENESTDARHWFGLLEHADGIPFCLFDQETTLPKRGIRTYIQSDEWEEYAIAEDWTVFEIRLLNADIRYLEDDVEKAASSQTYGANTIEIAFHSWTDGKIESDWVLVRKYNSPEPTAQLGTEETTPTYTPPNPTNLQNTTGNFWVNYTWDAGSGNVTNGYNVSNGTVWTNSTNTFYNESVDPSEWVNITVYAWNSSGSGTLSAGSVSDQVQVSAADTTFTVSLPVGYTKPVFEPPNSTATNYPPNGQTDLQEFYNVTNSGNVNLDIRMRLNTTVSTITLKADADNDPTGADTIGTSLVTVYPGLGQGSSANVWLWSDFDHTPPQTANRTVYINVSQS